MVIRGRVIYLVISVILVTAALMAVTVYFAFNRTYENAAMVVTWDEGIGKPLIVEGAVMRQGKPVTGQIIDVSTGSGGNLVTTGSDGQFSVNVGERELVAFEVMGMGRIEWGLLTGPSLRNGARFQVYLK